MARERTERGGEPAPAAPQHVGLSIAEIRQLITMMNGSDIEEIAIEQEREGLKLTLRKPAPAPAALDGDLDGYDMVEVAVTEEAAQLTSFEVAAPLVGLFRKQMKPGGKPLVAVGDIVREGQVVAAIEALNVLNEVEAGSAGRVLEILASDGQPVEYGQVLLVIEPHSA